MAEKKAEYLYMARLSEQTERFEDMVEYMKKYIAINNDLGDDERNLLSIAYKNTVGSRRTAWRAISALENKEKTKVYC
jgi:14-3-3 protein epsilon